MRKISVYQIENCVSEALSTNKKNILFVSLTLEYDKVLDWAKKHPEYCVRKDVPIEDAAGYYTIPTARLERLNNENVIWFHNAFSKKCVGNFEGVINAVKERVYTQRGLNSDVMQFSLEKLLLFIAFTTPNNSKDWASLDEKYYELFDEVYLVD